MNHELSMINDWLVVNKLSLNIGKIQFMTFAKQNKFVPKLNPFIKNTESGKVQEFNFVWVFIDCHLTWKPHINVITFKIAKCSGIIACLKHLFQRIILGNIYTTLFIPHFKKCSRSITNSHFQAHANPIFKAPKILHVDDIFLLVLFFLSWK